jgi:hypothetical protein
VLDEKIDQIWLFRVIPNLQYNNVVAVLTHNDHCDIELEKRDKCRQEVLVVEGEADLQFGSQVSQYLHRC